MKSLFPIFLFLTACPEVGFSQFNGPVDSSCIFGTMAYQVGESTYGSVLDTFFSFNNSGPAPITIESVTSLNERCTCQALSNNPIPPDGTGVIKIRCLNTKTGLWFAGCSVTGNFRWGQKTFTLSGITHKIFAWEETIYDMKNNPEGIATSYSFAVINTGLNPLIIDSVKNDCSCTTINYPKKEISPGSSGIVEVWFNAADPGPFRKTFSVFFKGISVPQLLEIKGVVIPESGKEGKETECPPDECNK